MDRMSSYFPRRMGRNQAIDIISFVEFNGGGFCGYLAADWCVSSILYININIMTDVIHVECAITIRGTWLILP